MLVATQLAGFAAGNLGFSQFTFRASASVRSNQITIPSGAKAGDFAMLFDRAANTFGSAPSSVTPSGWSTISGMANVQDGGVIHVRYRVCRKILTASDPGTAITGMNGDTEDKHMLVFGANVSSATVADTDVEGVTADPSAQTVTAASGTPPLIVFGVAAIYSGTSPTFSTASPSFDDTVSTTAMVTGYKIYNSSPADHTVDMNDLGNGNYLATCYVTGS